MKPHELSAKEKFISWVIYFLLQVFARTWRYHYVGKENLVMAASTVKSGAYAFALWHENILATLAVMRGTRMAPLASLSRDGAIVTSVMERMHFRTIRGSSSKGGPAARDELVAVTADGYLPTLTVDGPRGPRRVLKSGIVDIGRRTGVSVVPFAAVADRSWVLHKSWDQFQVPKPFATIHVVYGEPVTVPAGASGLAFGQMRAAVQAALDSTQAAAETLATKCR